MPTREEIMAFVCQFFDRWIRNKDDIWLAFYRLLLDYIYGVPRITDSNRLRNGIWRDRARKVENDLAAAFACNQQEVPGHLDTFMRKIYPKGTQRMNPIGIAFACGVVNLIHRFSAGLYDCKMEAKIGLDVFPKLTDFRRKSVDIVAWSKGRDTPFAVISSKWGIRHDRLRDPQEEADTYKKEVPSLKFLVVTNEFDNARLQKLLTYPNIDGVFHVKRSLVLQSFNEEMSSDLVNLKDITELLSIFL